MIEDGGVGGGSSPEIRPKADILTLKLREEAIVDEMLLDSARWLVPIFGVIWF